MSGQRRIAMPSVIRKRHSPIMAPVSSTGVLADCEPARVPGIKSRRMPPVRNIVSVLRATAVWLLVMFMFLGAAGPGAAAAFASEACGDSCPCDEPQPAEHDDDGCNEEADGHEDGSPPDDECPEDCRGCGCSPGFALTMATLTIETTAPPWSPNLTPPPSNAAAAGMGTGVFRPPRSRI
jgi:hypothetical protein